nr:MAG TPA: hypothetical protein [Microviridae sp.]
MSPNLIPLGVTRGIGDGCPHSDSTYENRTRSVIFG